MGNNESSSESLTDYITSKGQDYLPQSSFSLSISVYKMSGIGDDGNYDVKIWDDIQIDCMKHGYIVTMRTPIVEEDNGHHYSIIDIYKYNNDESLGTNIYKLALYIKEGESFPIKCPQHDHKRLGVILENDYKYCIKSFRKSNEEDVYFIVLNQVKQYLVDIYDAK